MNKESMKVSVVVSALLVGTIAMAGGLESAPMGMVEAPKAVTSNSDWSSKQKFFGFSQMGVGFGDGVTTTGDYKFQADRVRLGWKYFSGPLAGKVFLDFAKSGSDKNGLGVPEVIKDAFISYKLDDALVVKAGVIKTPVGMGFTIPGWNLDVIKRGFDKKLAFERAFGVMLSGRDMGFGNKGKVNGLEMGHERPWKGFGYDLMASGQTGRSGAVINANPGNGSAYMGRLMFDWTEALHLEGSYGVSQEAGGTNAAKDIKKKVIATTDNEDYKVMNFGIDSHFGKANLKAEYYDVANIRGVKGWDINTMALTATYYLTDTLEIAVKDIRGTETRSGKDATAANTYIGLSYYINPKNNKMSRKAKRGRNRHRVQINYVLADVDEDFKGVGALYKDDAILLQYQFKF